MQKSSIISSQRVIKLVAILGSERLCDRPGMPLSSTGFFDYHAKYFETPNTCCTFFFLLTLLALEVVHFSASFQFHHFSSISFEPCTPTSRILAFNKYACILMPKQLMLSSIYLNTVTWYKKLNTSKPTGYS